MKRLLFIVLIMSGLGALTSCEKEEVTPYSDVMSATDYTKSNGSDDGESVKGDDGITDTDEDSDHDSGKRSASRRN